MTTGLHLQNLCVLQGGAPLVALDAHIAPGEVLTVMGPSGVGKSTLLAAITGTLPHGFTIEGRIVLNGIDVTDLRPEQRHIGILFQEELLFPHLSVGGNLAFGLPPTPRGRTARRAKVDAALKEVDLPGFAQRDPATLSGGQKARVALMRMLLSDPKALLLDEAFSRLDTALRAQVRQLVFDRAKARALPVLMVTHDAEDAKAAGGNIVEITAQG
ncbi:ATP-binding cassette domain-containing protein [Actibacterium lipolyticum]|uniref:Spermidine/putrescine import ATP-binding protein PotA n=1 Tax=Actibacterium lipolyticum TaxID=1524263 RepID=A0A238KM23_9RHOB|nr:ATP-binding cassette domain-containing protein [Actibacterium lipolyticum]SMX43086.1 Spermidine/putrescine import ATP-binding protein PotA [Actibacterium lipolyticum]